MGSRNRRPQNKNHRFLCEIPTYHEGSFLSFFWMAWWARLMRVIGRINWKNWWVIVKN